MCSIIQKKYGSGPTLDKIRQAWLSLDKDKSGYITRQEFSTKAKKEIEKILSQQGQQAPHGQPGYNQPGHKQPGYNQPGFNQPGHKQPGFNQPGYGQPGYGQPGYGQPGHGPQPKGFGPHG